MARKGGNVGQRDRGAGSEGTQITICMSLLVGIISRKHAWSIPARRLFSRRRGVASVCSGKTRECRQGTWPPPPMIRAKTCRTGSPFTHGSRMYVRAYSYEHAYVHAHQNKYCTHRQTGRRTERTSSACRAGMRTRGPVIWEFNLFFLE